MPKKKKKWRKRFPATYILFGAPWSFFYPCIVEIQLFYYRIFLFWQSKLVVVVLYFLKGAGGGGGPRPKIIFNVIFVEGRQSYQMLFTGSKNIDPSPFYHIFKIEKYIQLPCGRALLAIISKFLILTLKTYLLLQFLSLRLETWQLSCSTHS